MKHVSNRGHCGLGNQNSLPVANPLRRRALHMAACGAVGMSLVLGGCSNSPTNGAAQSAAAASTKAAYYLATAGDYRPATNFPDHFSKPLTASELRLREQSAMHNSSAYLARNGKSFTSSKRDIRHAIAVLTTALNNSAISWQYKRVLYAQRAMCEDQLGAIRSGRMQADVVAMIHQLHTLDYSTLHLIRYAKKISYLQAEEKAYASQYASELQAARQHLQESHRVVGQLSARLQQSENGLNELLSKRKAALILGGRLEMQSSTQTGRHSLATLEAATHELNAAASLAGPIARARLAIARLRLVLNMAKARVAHAEAQVVELAAQRMIAQKIARRAGDQLKMLQAAVEMIIFGNSSDQMDVDHAVSAIKKSMAEINKDAGKAISAYRAAAQDFGMAINSQRTAYTVATQLMDKGSHQSDPLLKALQNKTPEALIEILKAGSTLSYAQMLRTQLMAKTLQKSAAELCSSTYSLVGKASPITSPTAADLAALRKRVILKMDAATVSLRSAKMNMIDAGSRIKWLQPAYVYAVNMGIVGAATQSAMIAKARAIADESAKQANSINPSLNLQPPPVGR